MNLAPLWNRINSGARVAKYDRVVGFEGRWLQIFAHSVLELASLLRVFFLVFLELFLLSSRCFACALIMNTRT